MGSKTTMRFMTLGKSKFVHVVRTKAVDLKSAERDGSQCMQVRKYHVAGKIKPSDKGISPEAALALEGCEPCATASRAASMIPDDVKRAARKEARDEVLARAKGGAKKVTKGKSAPKDAKEVVYKPKAEPTKTKAGVRSTGSSTEAKADALRDYGREFGWTVEYKDGEPGLLLVAQKDGQTINCWFIDGKYDIARHAYIEVGSWRGTLRGAHACRRQMEGTDAVHPNPGKGRSGPRKKVDPEADVPEDESPEDAARRVPFSLDDPDIEVIDAIKGKVIKWRNGVSGVLEEAWLPAEAQSKGKPRVKISLTTHPKTERRMVTFLVVDSIGEHGEMYGPERTVYLDKIVRVVG